MGTEFFSMMKEGQKREGRTSCVGLYNQTRIKLAYHSGALEGVRLLEGQVMYIEENGGEVTLNSGELITLDDIKETYNHFELYDYMVAHAEEMVSEELLRNYYRILKKNTISGSREEPGAYKKRKNSVGQIQTTVPEKVEEELAKVIAEYQTKEKVYTEDIFFLHCNLIRISPFTNCNGRIARMIMFKECLKHGVNPIMINDTQKSIYFRVLKDPEGNKNLAINLCSQAQQRYVGFAAKFCDKI